MSRNGKDFCHKCYTLAFLWLLWLLRFSDSQEDTESWKSRVTCQVLFLLLLLFLILPFHNAIKNVLK